MPRIKLPPRRAQRTYDIVLYDERKFTVTIGFYPKPDCRPAEVFIGHRKPHSQEAELLSDACCAISHALQEGIAPNAMAQSMLRVPIGLEKDGLTAPASAIGAAMELLIGLFASESIAERRAEQ